MCIYYTGYLTTNLINQKKYVGVHITNDPNDTYLGSGIALKQAIKKYGRKNFKKEVIAFMLNEEVMFEWEADTVTQEIIDNPMYYNISLGGGTVMTGRKHSIETKSKMRLSAKNRPVRSIEYRIKMSLIKKNPSKEIRAKISAANRARPPVSDETRAKMCVAQKGKKWSDAAKAKLSATLKGKPKSAETRENMKRAQQKLVAERLLSSPGF